MKKAIIFVLLKIVEISAVVFIPCWIGLWNPLGVEHCHVWIMGIGNIVLGVFIPLIVLVLVGAFLAFNWDLADKLLGRLKP